MRLSWPRDGDAKRFMTSRVSASPADGRTCADMELVRTSFFDMEMYYYLVELRSNSKSLLLCPLRGQTLS